MPMLAQFSASFRALLSGLVILLLVDLKRRKLVLMKLRSYGARQATDAGW